MGRKLCYLYEEDIPFEDYVSIDDVEKYFDEIRRYLLEVLKKKENVFFFDDRRRCSNWNNYQVSVYITFDKKKACIIDDQNDSTGCWLDDKEAHPAEIKESNTVEALPSEYFKVRRVMLENMEVILTADEIKHITDMIPYVKEGKITLTEFLELDPMNAQDFFYKNKPIYTTLK